MGPINENKIKKMGPTTKNGSSYFPSNYIVHGHVVREGLTEAAAEKWRYRSNSD